MQVGVPVELLLQPISAAHGGVYCGVEKEIFLCLLLRHVEYSGMSERILHWNGVEGLGKLKPWHPRGWRRRS